MIGSHLLLLLHIFLLFLETVVSEIAINVPAEKRLRDELINVHNWTVRPVKNYKDQLYVHLRFRLMRVAELDVKDQLLTLNVRIEQEWTDYKYKWDPDDYGGITQINIASKSIWRPDFELYNVFGIFEMHGPSAIVHSNGLIKWAPSSMLRVFCPIKVEYYPFDIQTCELMFGSWTHDGNLLFITLKDMPDENNGTGSLKIGMNLNDYYPSSEWDLLAIPAAVEARYYTCCAEPYISIKFNVTLRRFTHFYMANLVMPLVGLSYLSLLVFYLPADSNEKITLCVSILTCQVMFLLLMMDNIPVTSLAIPLLGKLIVFNMFLVFLSIFCTTIVLNIHYRKPTTHQIPVWVRRVRYTLLPKLLLLETVPSLSRMSEKEEEKGLFGRESGGESNRMDSMARLKKVSRLCSMSLFEIDRQLQGTSYSSGQQNGQYLPREDMRKALCNVNYVRQYMQKLEETAYECEDWKFLASVLDRIFLILFNIAFFVGTFIIMMDAPALFDERVALYKSPLLIDSTKLSAVTEENYVLANESEYEQGVVFDE